MIKYILGKLGFVFSESVEDKINEMIEHYENNQVVSYDSDNRYKHKSINEGQLMYDEYMSRKIQDEQDKVEWLETCIKGFISDDLRNMAILELKKTR